MGVAVRKDRIGKAPLEFGRLGRGKHALAALRAVVVLHAGNERGLGRTCALCARRKNAPQVIHARGLALGARERTDLDAARGVVPRCVGKDAEGTPDIARMNEGDIDPIVDLGDVGNRTRLDGIEQVVALKGGAFADKERTGLYRMGITRDPADGQVGENRARRRFCHQRIMRAEDL